jgi:acetyl-CoA carboxylase biotin carboxylase subunit
MKRIRKLYIANRGEIAVRIIRTCRALGIETVLGVSDADRESLGAKLADRAVCIGPGRSAESYLNGAAHVATALATDCDAVHPGFGFLSENSAFARLVVADGLIFVGPGPEQLDAVGDKLTARGHAEAAGVPLVPGRPCESLADAKALANEIGYPLLIKAVAGGGGRGMKRVDAAEQLAGQLDLARNEAEAAFGDSRVYIERLVTSGRHVEVQIIADGSTVLHAGERDCSVQRRYQKLIEEAPAPNLSETLRDALYAAAVCFARHIRYRSLGTVEFLVDTERDSFYFLEMNARIQVEHPVTEAITGLDLVALQLSLAEGQPLVLDQEGIQFDGHAIECRLNAEDIANDFRPSPGQVAEVWFPALAGLRVDTHIQAGSSIPPFYDSMIAKLIAHGRTRADALATLSTALAILKLEGVSTNAPLHRRILGDTHFRAGSVDTAWLPQFLNRELEADA